MTRASALLLALLVVLSVAPMAAAADGELVIVSEQDQEKSNNGKHLGEERGARGEPRLGPPSWAKNPAQDSDDDDASDDDDTSSDDDDGSSGDGGAPANAAPVAALSAPTTGDVDAVLTLDASGSSDADGDALTYLWSLDAKPPLSTAGIVGSGPTATLMPDQAGTYVVSVMVSDGTDSATAQATIEATTNNGAPIAVDDTYGVVEGGTLVTGGGAGVFGLPGVLANDSDPEGDPLTATVENGPMFGVLGFGADGSFTYTPNIGFAGTDTFTYRVSDGSSSAVGVVSIQVIDLP